MQDILPAKEHDVQVQRSRSMTAACYKVAAWWTGEADSVGSQGRVNSSSTTQLTPLIGDRRVVTYLTADHIDRAAAVFRY